MGDGVREWVDQAVRRLCLTPEECRVCDEEESRGINQAVAREYVRGRPRVWWLGLKRVDGRSVIDEFSQEIDRLQRWLVLSGVEEKDRVWFLPDPDDEGVLPAYEATPEAIFGLLGDTPGFEYYLVGRGMEWLIASTDHAEVLYCRGGAPP